MAALHIEEIDDSLYEAIRERAKRNHRSVDQQVVEMLREQLHSQKDCFDFEGFQELVKDWPDDRSAEEIIADIRNSRTSNEHRLHVFD